MQLPIYGHSAKYFFKNIKLIVLQSKPQHMFDILKHISIVIPKHKYSTEKLCY